LAASHSEGETGGSVGSASRYIKQNRTGVGYAPFIGYEIVTLALGKKKLLFFDWERERYDSFLIRVY
jgi:hypothetical protein